MAKLKKRPVEPEFDLNAHLASLSKLPQHHINKLVLVPSLLYRGRRHLDEDYDDERLSYRIASDFVEKRYPGVDAPDDVFPFFRAPVYGFKDGAVAGPKLVELMRLIRENGEVFYDELHLTEFGSPTATRAETAALVRAIDPDANLLVRVNGSVEFAPIDLADFRSMSGIIGHLEYSFSASFRRFVFPVIKGICASRPDLADFMRVASDDDGRLLKTIRPREGVWPSELLDTISDPSFLAAIFALRDTTPRDRAKLFMRLLSGEQGLTVGSRLQDGEWIGTGEHDPVPAPMARGSYMALLAAGLAEASHDIGEFRLSDNGRRLLDVLPEGCDDPDWLNRLVDSSTGLVTNASFSDASQWTKEQGRLHKKAFSTWFENKD